MPPAKRPEVPALPVRQWLADWEAVLFDRAQHRRKPPESFYVLSMQASQLRALCDIRRRSTAGKRSRKTDLGIQRRHNSERSHEIAEYVHHGFPWSSLSKSSRDSGEFDDLIKPGWLPTAIVVNILLPQDNREGKVVAREDLIEVKTDAKGGVTLQLPPGSNARSWSPRQVAPIEVIDGQHRLWAFEEDGDFAGNFDLPVVAYHGLDISWQAYLFYVINIKPTKINTSLAFDLYPLLRTEDWLEHAGGPVIYRESRAQELTEAMWFYPESPWHSRIDMLGESGRKYVTQAAWIRSLLATFIKRWESPRVHIGGLYGAPTAVDNSVLPWTRSQQAAFLVYLWIQFRDAVADSAASWTQGLREAEPEELLGGDAAFMGRSTLPNTDQGVRALLAVTNDLCYVRADDLELRAWAANEFTEGTSEIGIKKSLDSLKRRKVATFVTEIMRGLSDYDWRTFSAPGLNARERSNKARFRGSTGYRELRRDLLIHLSTKRGRVGKTAQEVLSLLKWD
jgi:hypothetical protein